MNSSSISTTRCRNSRTKRGSVSTLLGARSNKFEAVIENTVAGGDVLGRYIKEGRGAGWAR